MTHPIVFTNAVREWFDSHGSVDCTESNGRTELIATYRRLLQGKTVKQANKAVSNAVRTIRPIIAPQFTNTGLKRKAVGALTAHHASEIKLINDVKNPIQKARKKAKLEAENRVFIENNPFTVDYLLSLDELERVFQNIIGTKYAELGGLTLEEALESKKYAVYVCACLCLYVSMSLCLYVSMSLCLCVSSSRSTNSTSAPTPHS